MRSHGGLRRQAKTGGASQKRDIPLFYLFLIGVIRNQRGQLKKKLNSRFYSLFALEIDCAPLAFFVFFHSGKLALGGFLFAAAIHGDDRLKIAFN